MHHHHIMLMKRLNSVIQKYRLLKHVKNKEVAIVMGHWYAKIGSKRVRDGISNVGLALSNEKGDRCVQFYTENNWTALKTFFKLPKRCLYTWVSYMETKGNHHQIHNIRNNILWCRHLWTTISIQEKEK